jgi:NhaP-type Na+/H+ or K+/H+ antiporter
MTVFLLVFGVALLLAVLSSAFAARSPLSTSTVFLAVGIAAGPLGFSLIQVDSHQVQVAAEIALFAILFTDGQHAPVGVLRRRWREPTLALVVGMPATLAIVAALGHWLVGMPWAPALVVGAVLAPTDPVFASALVGRDDVPRPVREALNIESGLNDGLALPAVLVLTGLAGGSPAGWSTGLVPLLLEVAAGVALGIGLPLLVNQFLRLSGVGAEPHLLPLGPLAVRSFSTARA